MKSTANKMVVKNIVRRNIQFEKRRNIMIIIAIALASFLICFSGLIVTSLMEVQKKTDSGYIRSSIYECF
mgnify:CR=1 FL=1